jgi:uncharacterized phage-associated protein
MVYDGRSVANHFLELARKDGRQLTHMKLQKLLYFAHGWHLTFFDGEPLVAEGFQAWQYGPVSPSVYDAFRQFGSRPIDEPAVRVVFGTDGEGYALAPVPPISDDDEQTRLHIEKVYRAYKKCTAAQLSAATHVSSSPWARVKEKYPDNDVKVHIDNSIIREFFDGVVREARSSAGAPK